jgi:hypothetical protein
MSGAVIATLEPVRFGEFLRDRRLISDEQWLAALAAHWSAASPGRHRIGRTIIDAGYLPEDVVEAEARVFHEELDIIEFDQPEARRDTQPTLPRF